jgi:hypothetical protein
MCCGTVALMVLGHFTDYLQTIELQISPYGPQIINQGTPVSSTNKTDQHDITEILLKVVLNTINITLTLYNWYVTDYLQTIELQISPYGPQIIRKLAKDHKSYGSAGMALCAHYLL